MDRDMILTKLKDSTILFVDDDEQLLKTMEHIYQRYFKSVFLAKDGLEALEHYKTSMPSIVISDISMPKMNGIKMAEELLNFDKNLKIIFVTGHNEPEFTSRLAPYGGCTITKPVDIETLLAAILRMLEL